MSVETEPRVIELEDEGRRGAHRGRPRVTLRERLGEDGGVERVEVAVDGAGSPRHVALDRRTGLLEVDGQTFLESAESGFGQVAHEFEHPLGDPAVVRAVADSLGLGPGDAASWWDLAARNRFDGYPEQFYADTALGSDLGLLDSAYDLPRDYRGGLERSFASSGLPDCEEARKLAFGRPIYIAYALNVAELPFRDPDLICELMAHPQGPECFEAYASGIGASLWRYLVHLKGERELWRWLSANPEARRPSYDR